MATRVCPICKKPLVSSELQPFCGDRCRKIDLGNWLGEGYRVPAEEDTDSEEAGDGAGGGQRGPGLAED